LPSDRPRLTVRPEGEAQISRWRERAALAGLSLNEWVVQQLEGDGLDMTEALQNGARVEIESGGGAGGSGKPGEGDLGLVSPQGELGEIGSHGVDAEGRNRGGCEGVRVRSTGEADPLGVRGGKSAAPQKSVRLREGKVKPVACKQHEGGAKAWCAACRKETSSAGGSWA